MSPSPSKELSGFAALSGLLVENGFRGLDAVDEVADGAASVALVFSKVMIFCPTWEVLSWCLSVSPANC